MIELYDRIVGWKREELYGVFILGQERIGLRPLHGGLRLSAEAEM